MSAPDTNFSEEEVCEKTREAFSMGFYGAKNIGSDKKIIDFLANAKPFITCTAGQDNEGGPHVTFRFWNLVQAQDFLQMIVTACYKEKGQEAV